MSPSCCRDHRLCRRAHQEELNRCPIRNELQIATWAPGRSQSIDSFPPPMVSRSEWLMLDCHVSPTALDLSQTSLVWLAVLRKGLNHPRVPITYAQNIWAPSRDGYACFFIRRLRS